METDPYQMTGEKHRRQRRVMVRYYETALYTASRANRYHRTLRLVPRRSVNSLRSSSTSLLRSVLGPTD